MTRRAESAADPLDLGRSLPEGRVARVVPAPLSLGALHHVIRRHVGSAPARPTLARLAAASAGNPFVAVEIARMLVHGGAEHGLTDPLPLPRRLRELATKRVRVLPESAQELVLVAAALSRPTAAALAAALTPDVDAGPALRDAEEAGALGLAGAADPERGALAPRRRRMGGWQGSACARVSRTSAGGGSG